MISVIFLLISICAGPPFLLWYKLILLSMGIFYLAHMCFKQLFFSFAWQLLIKYPAICRKCLTIEEIQLSFLQALI